MLISRSRHLCRLDRGGDKGILARREKGGWNWRGTPVSVVCEMMRLFDINWSVADVSRELQLTVSRRVVEDEALFNECELLT